MKLIQKTGSVMMAVVLAMTVLQTFADEAEIHVGHTAAGQIKAHVEFPQPVELEPSIYPGVSGYATGLMGMHSIDLDEPDEDIFQLSATADLRFILLAKDPGMEVWNDSGSGYLGVGGTFFVGPPAFDVHPLWNLVTNTPGVAYSLTLKMHDVNGVYTDSEPFTISFTAQITRHQLNIARTGSQHATLSWTTNAVGWTLESAASMAAAGWDLVTNAPAITGTNFSLTIPTDGPVRFFRLRQQ